MNATVAIVAESHDSGRRVPIFGGDTAGLWAAMDERYARLRRHLDELAAIAAEHERTKEN